MFGETPKLIHAAVAAFICIAFIALCGYTENPRVLLAFKIGALIFALITAVLMGLIVLEAMNRRVMVMTEWMQAFARLNDEGRAAVAFSFPTMRFHMRRGNVRAFFEDTEVPMETFKLFLQTSNDKYISPERDWTTADMPRRDWTEIKNWLEANGYIHPDSAAGSHSWLWVGGSYRHLMAYWGAGRNIRDMNVEVL